MGWEGDGWQISVCMDAHSNASAQAAAELWAEMRGKLLEIARDPRYARLFPNFDEPDEDC